MQVHQYRSIYAQALVVKLCLWLTDKVSILFNSTRSHQKMAVPLTWVPTPPRSYQQVFGSTRNSTQPTICSEGRGGEEESPLVVLLASLCQLFEIQHFTQWHAPQCEDVRVQEVRCDVSAMLYIARRHDILLLVGHASMAGASPATAEK